MSDLHEPALSQSTCPPPTTDPLEYQCKYCLDTSINEDDFISPCNCRGSSQYVHRECLDRWRTDQVQTPNYVRCSSCRFNYELEEFIDESGCDGVCRAKRKRDVRRYLTFDFLICLIYISVFMFIAIGGVLLMDPAMSIYRWTPRWAWMAYLGLSLLTILIVGCFWVTIDNGRIRNDYHQGFSGFENMMVNGSIHLYHLGKEFVTTQYRKRHQQIWRTPLMRVRDIIKSRTTGIPAAQPRPPEQPRPTEQARQVRRGHIDPQIMGIIGQLLQT
jgi:hypothetical protein